MSEPLPAVFIVDDDEAVRDMLAMLVGTLGYRTHTFASAQDFLDNYSAELHGCLLLDVRLPGMTGLGLQARLNELNCILPIIFISAHGDIRMAVEALQRGALDFIEKPFREQDLLDKIAAAIEQDRKNRCDLLEKQRIAGRLVSLTAREHEVLQRVVAGQANKVIAQELDIAMSTVEIHRGKAMHKMQAHNLAHLMRMIIALDNDPPNRAGQASGRGSSR
jgi:FixJ family two-component response regulator